MRITVDSAKQALERVLRRAVPTSLRWLLKPVKKEFSIGIYVGDSPFSLTASKQASNPVLTRKDVTDVPAAFVGDPFMCRANDRWYMFFEVMNRLTWRGEIGLATSDNGMEWRYQRIVLAEPFHLSYPYVFEWRGEHYLIPECGENGGVRLYKATNFPNDWSYVEDLLTDGRFFDSSILRYQGKWWLFSAIGEDEKPPTLRLYFAENLIGPWQEHPASPLVEENYHKARPSGRMLVIRDRPIRFSQDLLPTYGSQVRAFEVLDLSLTAYEERQVGEEPVLKAGKASWNNGGMHHIDAHVLPDGSWIACVDGWVPTRASLKNLVWTLRVK